MGVSGVMRKGVGPSERLDVVMVQRGLAESRQRAQGLILAGVVRVDGRPATRVAQPVSAGLAVEVSAPEHPYVGRGGIKLAAALDAFRIDPTGIVALDVGASTGGFTDCLLQRGAAKVYAVDVGYGQLAWRLRQDHRVVVVDRCNARFLTPAVITESVHLATIDVSFISLTLILPAVESCLASEGEVIALFKPQFEVGKRKVGKGGIVRDERLRRDALDTVRRTVCDQGWAWKDEMASPITGQKGNVEYLIRLRRP